MPPQPSDLTPLARGTVGAYVWTLRLVLVLAPTAAGGLLRFGHFEPLFLVCLLLAFWVGCGLVGLPLLHLRSVANLAVWAVLGLVVLHVVPLPGAVLDDAAPAAPAGLIVEPSPWSAGAEHAHLDMGRWSLRPRASVGVLMLTATVVGFFGLVGASPPGSKRMRRATAAVLAGLTLLVLWAALDMATAAPRQQGVAPAPGLVVILGGDGLVPALLAALALALTAALRLRARRAGRGAAVGFLLASVAAGGAAFALGMCHAPAVSLVAVAALAAGVPLIAFAVGWPRRRRVAPGLAVWVAAALLAGVLAGPGDGPAASADAAVRTLVSGLGGARGALGIGAGALSARATLGLPGRPSVPGDDVDTDGFLVVRAELGWLGLALVLAASVALAALMVRRWRQGGGPWTRLAMAGGLGMLAANLAHFRTDAAALLAPNLLALAVAMGVVVGWAGEGARWRPARAARLGASRWPLVFGAVILIGSLALAESEMIQGGSSLPDLGDKVLHFGTFAMVALLLCYALGPRPSRSWLRTRVLAAVAAASLLGVAVEFGQRFLTDDRSFERADMLANTLGALSVGIVWWIIRRGQTPEEPA